MLRITRINREDAPVIKLEGQLLAAWTDELLHACNGLDAPAERSRLDLSSVTYIGPAGVNLLRDLRRRGFAITACSPFVAALLQLEKP